MSIKDFLIFIKETPQILNNFFYINAIMAVGHIVVGLSLHMYLLLKINLVVLFLTVVCYAIYNITRKGVE